MKKLSILLTTIILLASCADSKTLIINGKEEIIEPYGWMDEDEFKNDSVKYKVNTGNIVWRIILVETIIAPVILTGTALYEPIGKK